MTTPQLPVQGICLLDANPNDLADVRRELSRLPEPPAIESFQNPEDAKAFFEREAEVRRFETCVFSTDRVGLSDSSGVSAVDKGRSLFPRMRVIHYSSRTDFETGVRPLLERQRIHAFQKKVPPQELWQYRSQVEDQFQHYHGSGLEAFRAHLLKRPNPNVRVLQDEEGRWLTALDVYWHMVRLTSLGLKFQLACESLVGMGA